MTADGNPNRTLARRVIDLLEGDLGREGFALLDVRVFQGGGRLQVRIYVDLQAGEVPQGGITLDDVTRASRSAGMLLEEAELIPDRYVIEVSSPGIRRPLRTAEHFLAAVGQKVELKIQQEGRPRRLRGVLLGVQGTTVQVAPVAQATAEDPVDPDDPEADTPAPVAPAEKTPLARAAEPVTLELEQVLEANLDPEFDAQALIHADRQRKKQEKQEKRRARTRPHKSRPRKRDGHGSSGPDEDAGQGGRD